MNKQEVQKKLVLTKEQKRAVRVFDYIASVHTDTPYCDSAQNALNFVTLFMSRKRLETAARAVAKRSISAIINALCDEFPENKELTDISIRWFQRSFLVMCQKVRIQYETPLMGLFYWNHKAYKTIFRDAFVSEAIDILGNCTFEAPEEIWACVWNCTLTNM